MTAGSRTSMTHASPDNLGYLLTRAARRWSGFLEEELAKAGHPGLDAAHGAVLVPLFDHGEMAQADLVAQAKVKKATLSIYVGRLVDAGLVESVPDERDPRARRLRLTKGGQKLQRASEGAVERANERLLADLDESERSAAHDVLKALAALDESPR